MEVQVDWQAVVRMGFRCSDLEWLIVWGILKEIALYTAGEFVKLKLRRVLNVIEGYYGVKGRELKTKVVN